MNIINTIVSKIFIQNFYRRNAWWLLLLFLAFFGLVKNPILLHKELMLYIQGNGYALLAYIILVFLYSINVVLFENATFQKQENQFTRNLCLLPNRRKITIAASVQFTLLLPITIYSMFTVMVGINNGQYWNAVLLFVVTILSLTICIYSCLRNINGHFLRILSNIKISLPNTFVLFLLSYIWREQRKKLVWIKIVSLLILSIPIVRNNDDFQLSDFNIFWAASMSANLILLYDIFVFFNTGLRFVRQIPVSIYLLFIQILLTSICIMLPECLLVWFYRNGLRDINWTQYSVYSIGVLLLLYNIQWDKRNDFSNFMGIGALLLIGLLFLAAYKLFFLLGFGCAALGFVLFRSNYYSFQYQIDEISTSKKKTN